MRWNVSGVDWLWLALALLAGFALGGFYFGGLWWTVQRLPASRSPGLLTLASFFGRTVVALAGFYFVSGGQWQRLLACLGGFVAARFILVQRWGRLAGGPKAPVADSAGESR
jgi:F1F0 ATPase subunit 2